MKVEYLAVEKVQTANEILCFLSKRPYWCSKLDCFFLELFYLCFKKLGSVVGQLETPHKREAQETSTVGL